MKDSLAHLTSAFTWLATLSGLGYFVWGFAERLGFALSDTQDFWYEMRAMTFVVPLVLPALVGTWLLLKQRRVENATITLLFGVYVLLNLGIFTLHAMATDPLELGLPIIVLGVPVSIVVALLLVLQLRRQQVI